MYPFHTGLWAGFGTNIGAVFWAKNAIELPPSLVLGQEDAAVHAGEDRLEVDGALRRVAGRRPQRRAVGRHGAVR